MNISSHLFMPLCQYAVSQETINSIGQVIAAGTNKHTVYGSSFQPFDPSWVNCCQPFERLFTNTGSNSSRMIKLSVNQDLVDESYGITRYSSNVGDYTEIGNVLKGMSFSHTISGIMYASFTFKQGDYQSKLLMWKEDLPAALLSLGNSLSPDVIDDEEEMI